MDEVQKWLGTEDIYHLQPAYAARKQTLPQFKRIAGKAPSQPLILTAEMYEAIESTPNATGFSVQVAEGKGLAADGSDYAEKWEEEVGFLWYGQRDAEDLLPDLLLDIIEREMAL